MDDMKRVTERAFEASASLERSLDSFSLREKLFALQRFVQTLHNECITSKEDHDPKMVWNMRCAAVELYGALRHHG